MILSMFPADGLNWQFRQSITPILREISLRNGPDCLVFDSVIPA